MMAITVPIIFAYFVGTISSWIGYVCDMEPIIGGLAVAIAGAASMGARTVVAAFVAALMQARL
jgi:hypothetical protein